MEIKYCKNCGFPNTRPNIHFIDNTCEGCQYEKRKKEIDWTQRWKELKQFIKQHPSRSDYDVIIAVSGGKDSHFLTHLYKEKLGLNCLLVCVSDNMKPTRAGEHNLQNLAKEFDSDLFIYKMKPEMQKKIMRYTTEKYGKPLYIIDRLIYTVPIDVAVQFKIPIVVYGENVAVTRGAKDNRDVPEAWNQIKNGVANDIPLEEIEQACQISEKELRMAQHPSLEVMIQNITTPIYTSYFVEWDAWKNYQFAKLRGFWDLNGIWDRWDGFMNYWQIDSYGYMVAFDFKFAKLGHSGITDCACELIRAGHLDKEEGWKQIKKWEGVSLPEAVSDFCSFVGYKQEEYFKILNTIKERFQNAKK